MYEEKREGHKLHFDDKPVTQIIINNNLNHDKEPFGCFKRE